MERYVKKMAYLYDNEKKDYVHRLIWKENNGEIPWGGVIHHIDMNPNNNDVNNLHLFLSAAEHTLYHHYVRKYGFIHPKDFSSDLYYKK